MLHIKQADGCFGNSLETLLSQKCHHHLRSSTTKQHTTRRFHSCLLSQMTWLKGDKSTLEPRAAFDDCNLDVGCQWRLPPWRWTWRTATAASEDANNRQCHLAMASCHSNTWNSWNCLRFVQKSHLELLHFNVYILCCWQWCCRSRAWGWSET